MPNRPKKKKKAPTKGVMFLNGKNRKDRFLQYSKYLANQEPPKEREDK